MNGNLPVFSLLLPLTGAVGMLLWTRKIAGRNLAATVLLAAQFLFSCFLVMKTYDKGAIATVIGGWKAPYGIALVVDLFSSIMLAAANLIFLASTTFGFAENPKHEERFFRLPLIFFLQTGMALSFVTADFFNLFVAFEIMLVSSYVLIATESDASRIKYAYYYIILNMIASFLFLAIAAMIYGYTGSLNMAELSLRLETIKDEPMILAISVFALIIYGLKAGVFPFYFWLPDSYPSLPNSLAGLFSSILTKVGIYVLIRLFITVLPHGLPWVYETMLTLAGFTMLLGVLGAVSKSSIKEILCYHILSQVGYMVMALGFFSIAALSAGIFFILHNMIVKSSLILIGGIVIHALKTDKLEKISGFSSISPFASIFFILQALSLAGMPPFSGFWGKYLLFFEGIRLGYYFIVIAGVVTSFLTLYSMIKIWTKVFWGPKPEHYQAGSQKYKQFAASTGILVAAALAMGLGAEGVIQLTSQTSRQLFNKKEYIEAVFAVKGSEEKASL